MTVKCIPPFQVAKPKKRHRQSVLSQTVKLIDYPLPVCFNSLRTGPTLPEQTTWNYNYIMYLRSSGTAVLE